MREREARHDDIESGRVDEGLGGGQEGMGGGGGVSKDNAQVSAQLKLLLL